MYIYIYTYIYIYIYKYICIYIIPYSHIACSYFLRFATWKTTIFSTSVIPVIGHWAPRPTRGRSGENSGTAAGRKAW